LHRRRLEGADDADARVVDQDVDFAGLGDGARDAVGVGDIQRDQLDAVGRAVSSP
jgi:hypothetical protein